MVMCVNALAKPQLVGSEPCYQAPQRGIDEKMQKAVDRVFLRLKSIFPAWKSAFPDDESYAEAKKLWLETLWQEQISFSQLKQGLEQARMSQNPFFPSVGQFVAWCKTNRYADLGLPDENLLRQRIGKFMFFGMENVAEFKFHNNAEYWLITTLYQRNQKSKWDEPKLKLEIKRELAKMAERVNKGEAIPEPIITLPAQGQQGISKAKKLMYIAKMKAMLGKGLQHESRI